MRPLELEILTLQAVPKKDPAKHRRWLALLTEILEEAGAAMVCGFTRTIDWVESAAFDTVLINRLANGQKANSVEQLVGSARWVSLTEHLGFRMAYRTGSGPRIPVMRRPESAVSA